MNFAGKKILITGGTGFLGRHVTDYFRNHVSKTTEVNSIGSKKADLRYFKEAEKVTQGMDVVVHLGADCGGIGYNRKYPGQLFYRNMAMGMNIMEACRLNGVKKVVLTGSVCGYPKFTKVPFKEEYLFDGYPETTNAPYGIAKRDMLVMAQAYRKQYGMNAIYLLIVNLYGEYDHFWNQEKSHVIPALIEKFVEAKEEGFDTVELWGTGQATREFLYAPDASEAIYLATKMYDKPQAVNVGVGYEISIMELAEEIKQLIGYQGRIMWNTTYPDGQPRRCLDVSKAKKFFNFKAKTSLKDGLKKTIEWYFEADTKG